MKNPYLKQALCTAARSLSGLWLLCLLSFPHSLFAQTPLSLYQATYNTRLGGVSVDINRELSRDAEGHYQLRLRANTFLMGLSESTVFKVNQEQIKPIKYSYEGSGLNRRVSNNEFDWKNNTVKTLYKDKHYHLPLTPQLHDRLSWQEYMRLQLLNSKNSKTERIRLVSGKRIKEYDIEYIGDEIIDTPLGRFNALHYTRLQDNSDREFHVWLAKDWDYIILKLKQIEPDDEPTELVIKSGLLGNKPISGLL